MPRLIVTATAIALALSGAAGTAFAQGVAPGGPIGNSTGIGSGLGTPGGTGPSWPNGTQQPTLSPPGGGTSPSMVAPRAMSTSRPYPQPLAPFEASHHKPSTVPLSLPDTPAPNVSFLRGCWRTDVFLYAQHTGLTTWCFDDKGAGHFMYTRTDQPDWYCHANAEATYAQTTLHLHGSNVSCSDGSNPGDLDCHPNGETAECSGEGNGTLRLYRVR
ncbi:MAG TPA: hypothetical protein VMI56_02000 [Reyranella sp.]|nr:hypothetical protein [Reyranella sp.]